MIPAYREMQGRVFELRMLLAPVRPALAIAQGSPLAGREGIAAVVLCCMVRMPGYRARPKTVCDFRVHRFIRLMSCSDWIGLPRSDAPRRPCDALEIAPQNAACLID